MHPKFLPTTLEAISPTIDLETVINRVSGPGLHCISLFHRSSDDALAIEVDGALVTIDKAGPHLEGVVASFQRAAKSVLEGLRSGDLAAYVMKASDSTFWRIPRFYFMRKGQHELAHAPFGEWESGSGEDPSMYGQPLLVAERQFSEWLAAEPGPAIHRTSQNIGDPPYAPPAFIRAILPALAKPSDKVYEEFAHRAAELVLTTGISAQRAFERVAPNEPMKKAESVASAVRRSYELMYDRAGRPL